MSSLVHAVPVLPAAVDLGTAAKEALGNDALASPNSAQMYELNKFVNPEAEISRLLLISV